MTSFDRYIEKLRAQGKLCRIRATLATGKRVVEVNLGEYYFVWDSNDNTRRDFKTFDDAREYCKESWL